MYVGVLSVICGLALLFRSPAVFVYALCVATCFHLFVVLYEERHLRALFGAEYEAYCARVGRWLPGRGGTRERKA
jgi:protein-S-isoprenylcysteine O-methyltransferase Ste14